MENSWSFSGRDSFFDRFSGGKYHTESYLENGMETENPGFFLSDPEFCGERYFRRSIFAGSVTTQGSTLSFSVFLFFCGFTIFGVPLSVAYMLILGMETGLILTLSVLEFGIYGGVAGAGLLIPQYVIYIPVYFYLAGLVYRQSYDIWKNYGLVPQKSRLYIRQGMTAFLVYTGGILAESFLNPWILEKVVKGLKFF